MISVVAPWGDKRGVVSVVGVEWYAVVTVPCVEDSFLLPLRDRSGLVEG